MLRVLSLNLQHGAPGVGALGVGARPADAPDGSAESGAKAALADVDIRDQGAARAVLLALAEQIRKLEPDVVALQEVDLNQPRSGRLDQTAVLSEALGMPFRRFAATYAGSVVGMRRRPLRSELSAPEHDVFGRLRAAIGAGPIGYGNALLSRHPVSAWHVMRLGRGPASLERRGTTTWDPRSYRLVTASQRLMLAATVELPGGAELPGDVALPDGGAPRGSLGPGGSARLSAACVHLATRADTAAGQLTAAWQALAGLPGPHLLAGDCNMPPERIEQLGVARMLGHGATFPAGRPERRIDHFLTGADGAPAGVPVLNAVDWGTRTFVVSDHAGTWVDLAAADA